MIRNLVIIAFCTFLVPCVAQERLTVSTTDAQQPSVLLKWFDERFIFPEGINIYRVDLSNQQRIKLNDQPIRKGDYKIPASAFANDTTLEQYQEILDAMEPQEIRGIISALLLVKALQSTPFSLYAGMMFEDSKAQLNATYSYEVFRLVNGREVLIERSKPITVQRFQADKAPDSIDIRAGDKQVFISWKPEEKRFWGVNVYRKMEGEEIFVRINGDEPVMISMNENEKGVEAYPDVFVTDENLRNGIVYTYQIAGIDFFSRETEWSEPISVMPKDNTPPLPPTNLRAEFKSFNIELTWNADFKSVDLKGYHVYRSRGRQGEQIRLTSELLDKESLDYTDHVRDAGTYHYFVASVDSSGNEARSFRAVVEVLDVFPPARPTNFRVIADTGRMVLTWQNPTDPDFAGIRVYRTTNSDRRQAYTLLNSQLVRDTIFIDVLPKNARSDFFYRIAALDSSLNISEFTEAAVGQMPDITPPSPPFLKRIEQEGEAIVLHWNVSPESDVEKYIIYRFEPRDSARTYMRVNRLDLPPTANLFTDRMLKHRTEYAYELVAVDSSGNVSEHSQQKRLVFLSERTDQYTFKMDISVRRNGRRVRLNWDLDAEYDTPNFVVFKRLSGTDEFIPASGLTRERRFTDNTLAKGQRFEYQVRAYSSDGEVYKSNTRWAERTR
jgi:fibronectin type 3 domain-containing protein